MGKLKAIIQNSLARRTLSVLVAVSACVAVLGLSSVNVGPVNWQVGDGGSGPFDLRLGLDLQGGAHLVYQAVRTPSLVSFSVLDGSYTTDEIQVVTSPILQADGFEVERVTSTGTQRYRIFVPCALGGEDKAQLGVPSGDLVEQLESILSTEFGIIGDLVLTSGCQEPSPLQMEGVRYIIEQRINPLGITEPDIRTLGSDRILLQLPGAQAIEDTKSLIGQTANLSFKLRELQADGNFIDRDLDLSGDDLLRAYPGTHPQSGMPVVNLEFDADGAREFAALTAQIANTSDQLAFFLDEREVFSGGADEAILGGRAYLRGISAEEAQTIAIQLESGKLPIPIELIQEWQVDASLGADSLKKSLVAGVVGLISLFVFMTAYYRLPGLLASIALLVYATITLGIFKILGVTLTLSGIAGMILSIGMAVDANILIFERVKEELRAGRTIRASIEVGFNRAWTAIRDSNISTLITCVILLWFGTRLAASLVLGFAVTLSIGVIISMFTALFVTKTLLQLVVTTKLGAHVGLFIPSLMSRDQTQ